jgi:23S rRNA (adenine2503-C2)-methyltransferase
MNESARDGKRALLDLEPTELERFVVECGGRPFHARIVREEVFRRGVLDYAQMTSLPGRLRASLAEALPILSARSVEERRAPDGTTKLLIAFPARREAPGGAAALDLVETVHSPPRDGVGSPEQGATLCVSTQVGCPVGCPFCASGLLGLQRNLTAAEIIEQYLRGRAIGPLARSVVMGIGEPLLNYGALERALRIVTGELGMGARRITVSTVGFPARLRRIAPRRPPFQLAISLHTPFDDQRAELVPAMAGVPIDEVLAAGDDWFEKTGREVTYEYVLLAGVNDGEQHARALSSRLEGRRATVNLIPYNPVGESPFARPEASTPERFACILRSSGLVATVRRSRGLEADAACGQLRAAKMGGSARTPT